MFAKAFCSRIGAAQLFRMNNGLVQTRSLSSEGIAAVDKLKGALEQYRVEK